MLRLNLQECWTRNLRRLLSKEALRHHALDNLIQDVDVANVLLDTEKETIQQDTTTFLPRIGSAKNRLQTRLSKLEESKEKLVEACCVEDDAYSAIDYIQETDHHAGIVNELTYALTEQTNSPLRTRANAPPPLTPPPRLTSPQLQGATVAAPTLPQFTPISSCYSLSASTTVKLNCQS